MASTIVTFELVLFDRGNRQNDESLCAYFEKAAAVELP